MNRTPSYYFVFFLPNKKAMHKKVEKPLFNSLAQDEVLTEIELAGITHVITERRSFNIINSTTCDFFLVMNIIKKPD